MEQPLQLPETVESHGGDRDSVDMAERDDGGCAAVLKRKRGRPAKGVPKTTTPLVRQKKDEEDVCFICFDGGSLVLCDRRGCPKAYHPTCIKRDEAFFRSKAKWNCGWHICSYCGKSAHYMCYTCTYSLCKGCTNDADFVCVRGNKGLCGICMKTILLIENSAQGNKTTCEVDFDDKSSWEYLFKVYWTYLKEKLSLTFDELLQAKKPWKGAASMNCKVQAPHELHHLKDDKGSGSENSCIDIESNNLKNKKPRRRDYVGHITQDVPTTCESAVNCVTDAIVVRPEASDVAKDISSSFLSEGMEQPIDDVLNDKLWHYLDPTGKVQGPFSGVQLFKWNTSGHFPPDLRIWRVDENQENSILLVDALSGKRSRNVFSPCNSQQLSSGASFILDNKDNSEDQGSNATRRGLCANRQSVEQNGEQKVDDTCAQSNGKDESIRSNEWNSQSPCFTIQADGNNNEGQSGNFERREDSSKCEISCNNHHHVYHSLPSTALSEELNENPCDKLLEDYLVEENTEGNGNDGSNKISEGQGNGGQTHQKRPDCEENSGQSSDQNWRCPNETHPVTLTLFEIFGDESSVPDFLAEVEAMKSLGDLEFPTSNMKCGEELTDGPIADCLSFEHGLSPILDAVKGDALSSSADLQFPSQSTAPVEPFRQAVVHHDHQIISGEHSSRSSEVKSTFPRTSWDQTITNQYSWDPNR